MKAKIFSILGPKKTLKYKFFLFANILNFFLEFISLLSIPIFVSSIISKDNLLEKINFIFNKLDLKNEFIFSNNLVFLSALLIVISFYLKNIFLGLIIYNEKKFFKNLNVDLKRYFFNHYIEMPYLLHVKKNPSELVRSTMNDVKNSASFLEYFSILCRDIVALIVILLISLSINFLNTLIIFFIFLIFSFIYFYFIKPLIKKKAATNQILENNIIKLLFETYSSIKDIKILSKENEIKNNFENKVSIYEKNRFFFDINNRFPRIIMEIFAITLIILISTYYFFTYKNTDNLFNILSVYVVLIVRFIPAFNSLTLSYGLLKMFTPSINFLSKELQIIKNFKSNKNYETELLDERNFRETDFIKLVNLSFKYPGSKKSTLIDVNLSINKGQIIGLLGPTGVGKTTLFHLMLGLFEPDNGRILYNGKDIFKNLKNWRKKIGYISQDIFLLDSSIKENIIFNNDNLKINQSLFSKCIDASQLREKIESLPERENTKVGVHGLELSGGERQRIAIARTLYKNPNIIFLDEFTSSLDSKTEEKILDLLIKYKKDKTMIIISHRESTLKFCDAKYTIEDGKIKKVE